MKTQNRLSFFFAKEDLKKKNLMLNFFTKIIPGDLLIVQDL